ncbi:MAG TPA: cysteine synthase family protein [Candidatus Caccenecus avistercoris]|nr:cysteine synthase family protein [Candidatus Caccenecus avistercoris]
MIDKLIGNTPMVKIKYRYQDKVGYVYAKLEYYNYTGSIKDRVAYYILKRSKELGLLKDNQPIVEATSGNTGISFAALGAYYNHPVHIFMPDWASVERVSIMKLYKAHVHLVSKEEGGFREAIRRSEEYAKKLDGFLPRQFENNLNVEAHYNTTAKEIVSSMPLVDTFVSGIGTGGTLMGVAKYLKEKDKTIKIIALEPNKMPLLSGGKIIGNHKIEGIGDDFIPKIVDKEYIDDIIVIDDEDAINMSRLLAKKLGLGVGISSGANFLASVLSNGNNVATVFADDFKKYLTTDLTKEIDTNPKLLSNQIELLDMEVIN